jgi:MFS family permease
MKTEPPEKSSPNLEVEPLTSTNDLSLPSKRVGYWSVLGNRNYALLFWSQLISAAGTQMQVVAVSWQVYSLTHSAVALGLIGLFEALPRLLLSLVGGVFADLFDRRKLLLIIDITLAVTSTILALCTVFHIINVAIIFAVVCISACASAFEFPTRQSMIPTLVPREQMAGAVSLFLVMMQLTFALGLSLGGLTIARFGLVNTYWLDVLSYLVVIGSLFFMHVPRVPLETRARSGIGALFDGMKFLRAHPVILGVLSLDFFATFFGSPKALLPIYANDVFHVGAQGFGLLVASISIGAVILTPFAAQISRIPRQGLGVILSVIAWGICITIFGLIPGPFWLAIVLLAGAGAADLVSTIMRGLVIQLTTPDEFSGRMNAVNAMFVFGGPMLGQFESGMVAGFTTPQFSVVTGGIACVISALIIAACIPSLLRVKVH